MRKLLGVLALALGSIAWHVDVRAQFCPGASPWVFDDVLASDPFCGYITWMAQEQITGGCALIDANHRLYCPNDAVNRKQMAAFVYRAAASMFPTSCASGQVLKWNGADWNCANDSTGASGTVTSIASGAGLTGGPITTSGTLAIASGGVTAAMLASNGCTNGQILKYNGASWACAADNSVANAFVQGGNNFNGTAILGTTDNHELHLRVNASRVMRYHPHPISPNIAGGHSSNAIDVLQHGQTIGGGGRAGSNCYEVTTETNTRECANRATTQFDTVSGGEANLANAGWATVAGGAANTASGLFSAIGGGAANLAPGDGAVVAGGNPNFAFGRLSAIGGGQNNYASGEYATIPGGQSNIATGQHGLAAGFNARADQAKCFVFGGWSSFPDQPASCLGSSNIVRFAADHGFSVEFLSARTDGGGNRWVYIGDLHAGRAIDTWVGAHLSDTGQWNSVSDAASKTNFEKLDARALLRKVVALPVTYWRYKSDPEGTRHVGPTAQDFKAAFGLGQSDTTIGMLDSDGVALAAIQGLHAELADRDQRIASLERAIDLLRSELEGKPAGRQRSKKTPLGK